MANKSFTEARMIVNQFNEYFRINADIHEIKRVELNTIGACDKVVFPPFEEDETADTYCIKVTVKEFTERMLSLPDRYEGMRVYYAKPEMYTFSLGEPEVWTNVTFPVAQGNIGTTTTQ